MKKYLNAVPTCGRTINQEGSEVETMLVVKAKIKDYATGYNVAGDFADALNEKVAQLIKDAVKRADANGRRTVMAKDI
jgi:histone H3/H4